MEQLYESQPYARSFDAVVRACGPAGGQYAVTLDRTAFYPEGGGQPCDLGTLDGVPVLDVREQGGQIVHTCAAALPVGARVHGVLDWERRFRHMQQHAADHIVSGLIHNRFGYENVGFHMGSETVTMDYSGVLTQDELRQIESQANRVIWDNIASQVLYPTAEELASLTFRSKKEIEGQVRLVHYPGVDLCACCGLHVARTGEIGLIKLLSCVKFHSGCRVEMLCGGKALAWLNGVFDQNRRVSGLLSAKPMETADAVLRLTQELADAKSQLAALHAEQLRALAATFAGKGDVLLFRPEMPPAELAKLSLAIATQCGGRSAVFSGDDRAGYRYAIAGEELWDFTKAMNDTLAGRGGGKPNFVQGSVAAGRAAIERFFADRDMKY